MRIGFIFIAAAALVPVGLAVPCSAQSGCDDCNSTFTLNSSYTGGGTIDGTLTLDLATDMFTAADLTISGFPSYQDGTLTDIGQQGDVAGTYGVNIFSAGSPAGGDLFLALPTSTLDGYDGSAIVLPTDVSFSTDPILYKADAGTLAPATSVTPEPQSLLLLATGLLGLAGLMWRRFAAA